ncbi:MAG: EAL domain-containing protein [Epsilonproteobacteria bacterium]|nr:EAL domain-containing protein [Campylobacterota bacterium]
MKQKAKILIVDDHQVNRMTVKLSLKNEDYIFFEAQNGLEAIQKAQEEKPDIILIDALMPLMDGFDATKEIRAMEEIQRIPILMITSLDQKEDKIKALESGVNDFISKPFDKLELQARCKSYIEISKLNKKYTLATKNAITNLPNKIALLKDIVYEQESKELFLIKIDNFDMNENFFGVTNVQHLERIFVEKLQHYSQQIDATAIYHIGSGKYALLLDLGLPLNKESVISFCENMTSEIKKTKYTYKEYQFDVNVTVGFATNSQTLYEDANAVLTAAIIQKKDFLLSADVIDEIKGNLKENLNMLKTIKVALKNDQIFPYYQPIYNIKTGELNRYEALIRMIDSEGKLISPEPFFLNIAKKGKLYPEVTKVLFQKVLAKIRESGYEISVNLSSFDIEDHAMSTYLLELMEKNRDITNKLIFELLEDKDTEDYAYVNDFIQQAKKMGVKIAIDDFGSGFSNFIRIIEFKPDIIKIDGSLIEDIAHSSSHQKTVEAIKIFADKIHAKTVAEYVTDEEVYRSVQALGIDYAQGFYIGKPEKAFIETKALELAF